MKTIKTIITETPERDALLLAAFLGADKGIPAHVHSFPSGGWDGEDYFHPGAWGVEAEGKRVVFTAQK